MVAGEVFYVNQQRDMNVISFARKAILMYGLSLCLNGTWDESQISQEL